VTHRRPFQPQPFCDSVTALGTGSRSGPRKKLHLFPAMRDPAFFTPGSSSAPVTARTPEQGALLPARRSPWPLPGWPAARHRAVGSRGAACTPRPLLSLGRGRHRVPPPTWCQEGSVHFLPLLPSLTPSVAPGPSAIGALIATHPAPFCPQAQPCG